MQFVIFIFILRFCENKKKINEWNKEVKDEASNETNWMCMGLRGMLIALRAHKPRHLVQLQLQNVTEICMQSATPKQQMPDSRGYKNKTYIVHTYMHS